jgi:hypothetical protein
MTYRALSAPKGVKRHVRRAKTEATSGQGHRADRRPD